MNRCVRAGGAELLAALTLAPGLGPALSGCAPGGGASSYRYRMTVEIATPAGLRRGSGVIGVEPGLTGEHAANMSVDGEAVPVDLPGGRTAYVLLRSRSTEDWAGWIVLWLVRTPALARATMAENVRVVAATRGVLTLPRRFPDGAGYPLIGEDARPTFVTFGNAGRSETVRIVDPDDIAAGSGHRIALHRITLQVTDDPVTRGIDVRLP